MTNPLSKVHSSYLLLPARSSSFTPCPQPFAYMLITVIFFTISIRLIRCEDLNKHETEVENSKSVLKIILIVVLIVAAFFILIMIYACRLKMKKQKKLEETRKKIGGTVVTAGTAGSQASNSGTSKTGMKSNGSVDDEELKKFTCRGPVVMQSRLCGEVKHALDNSPSQSLKNPLQFDPAHNEIVYIGTDVDRIRSVPKSRETSEDQMMSVEKYRSIESKKGSNVVAGDSTQQSETQRSRWARVKKGLPSIPTLHLFEIEVTQTGSAESAEVVNIGANKKRLKTKQQNTTSLKQNEEHKKTDILVERCKPSFTNSGASASSTSAHQHALGVARTPHDEPSKKGSAKVFKEERRTRSKEEKNTLSKEERHRTGPDSSSSHSSKEVKRSRAKNSSLRPTQEDNDDEAQGES